MILVDTNVIVDIWKNKNDEYSHVFNTEPICICGVVRSELLHGAYSEKNLTRRAQEGLRSAPVVAKRLPLAGSNPPLKDGAVRNYAAQLAVCR